MLNVAVSWSAPLVADSDVYVLLSQSDCTLTGGGCVISRSISGIAKVGTTQLALTFEQIHHGDYKAQAILDRNRDFGQVLFPDHGDGVSFPLNQVLSVPSRGVGSASLTIPIDLP
jgi:hypothetical protein